MTAHKKKPAPKKPTPRDFIMVQVSAEQRATFEAAAKEVGMPVSTWLRAMGMVAARKGVK